MKIQRDVVFFMSSRLSHDAHVNSFSIRLFLVVGSVPPRLFPKPLLYDSNFETPHRAHPASAAEGPRELPVGNNFAGMRRRRRRHRAAFVSAEKNPGPAR